MFQIDDLCLQYSSVNFAISFLMTLLRNFYFNTTQILNIAGDGPRWPVYVAALELETCAFPDETVSSSMPSKKLPPSGPGKGIHPLMQEPGDERVGAGCRAGARGRGLKGQI